MKTALAGQTGSIDAVLPPNMAGQSERLIKRALMTFARKPDLQACPVLDFVRCVIEAAEMGLAIDGKLCHVVRYKNTWQCQPDYKGLIATAKRSGQIADCIADVVHEYDEFEAYRQDGRDHLSHRIPLAGDRGRVIGAYCQLTFNDQPFRFVLMTKAELDKVKNAAPSKSGPWATWETEMQKKTVIRRALKAYCDDPGIIRALELTEDEEVAAPPAAIPVGRVNLRAPKPEPIAADIEPDPAPPIDHYQSDPPVEVTPEPAPVAEAPASVPDADAELEEHASRVEALENAIQEATSRKALHVIGADLVRMADDLGKAEHARLTAAYQEKVKTLGK